jgi:hypothetical protein
MESSDDGPPPLFRSWRGWYALVLAVLAAIVAGGSFVSYVLK